MIIENNEKFEIDQVLDFLPVNYKLLKGIEKDMASFTRNAKYEIYNSGTSQCFSFYKPISRIIKDKDGRGI